VKKLQAVAARFHEKMKTWTRVDVKKPQTEAACFHKTKMWVRMAVKKPQAEAACFHEQTKTWTRTGAEKLSAGACHLVAAITRAHSKGHRAVHRRFWR
jgi:hypothetical protein